MAVWVTGLGATTCVGTTVDALWQATENSVSGLRNGLGFVADLDLKLSPRFAAQARGRAAKMALLTMEQAMQSAGWDALTHEDGFILATTTGQISLWEKPLAQHLSQENEKLESSGPSPLMRSKSEFIEAFSHQPLGDLLHELAQSFDFTGRRLLISSACSAATQALAMAALWLEQGLVKRCLVGGVEVLSDLTIEGFSCLQLLSRQPCRPFDLHRSGINLAEGSGFLCLEGQATERAQAQLSGYAISSDGHHMTAPHPEGKGCYLAMKNAIAMAGLEPANVDWVHAHGTGSTHNDFAESLAIQTLFGTPGPWVSSSKWVHGHALGASGAVESILCVEALKRGMILKTHGMETVDERLKIRHPQDSLKWPLRHVLKSTLGFGGTNAALLWSQAHA